MGGTKVGPIGVDLGELSCGFLKLGRGNTGKQRARPDLVVFTYCEKGYDNVPKRTSTLIKYLRDLVKGIRLICGINYGTGFDFERSGNYFDFKQTELITQELANGIQLEDI